MARQLNAHATELGQCRSEALSARNELLTEQNMSKQWKEMWQRTGAEYQDELQDAWTELSGARAKLGEHREHASACASVSESAAHDAADDSQSTAGHDDADAGSEFQSQGSR